MKAKVYFVAVLFVMLYKVVLTFEFSDEIQKCRWPFKCKLLSRTFAWCCSLRVLTFETVKEILKWACDL